MSLPNLEVGNLLLARAILDFCLCGRIDLFGLLASVPVGPKGV